MKVDQIAQLERLVDELMKTKPNQSQVQTYMKNAGLNYTTDPVEQLSSVLSYLESRRATSASASQSKSKVREDEPSL